MIRRCCLLAVGLLAACDPLPSEPEPLAILSVMPQTQRATETKTVRVQLNADPVFRVDYSASAAQQVDAPVLKVGYRAVPLTFLGRGVFEGVMAPMVAGVYPMTVSLDGREASFETPYQVTTLKFSYEFVSIPPQVRGQPFVVTIKASARGQSPDEPTPSRTATLTVFTGGRTVFTAQLGPYTPGEVQQYVAINEVGDDFVARINDNEGEQAYSNAFPVAPPLR